MDGEKEMKKQERNIDSICGSNKSFSGKDRKMNRTKKPYLYFQKGDKIFIPARVLQGHKGTGACMVQLLYDGQPFYIPEKLTKKCIMR